MIQVSINIDGLPISNSGNSQFWPILLTIENMKLSPMVIGIFYGWRSKTRSCRKTFYFLTEACEFFWNGYEFGSVQYKFEVLKFLDDVPATALIKKIKDHGGIFSSGKSNTLGVSVPGTSTFLWIICTGFV